MEVRNRSDTSTATERIIKEKDEQITELLEEGEKLSKQQLQSNNIIKKLRAKEKENDQTIKSQRYYDNFAAAYVDLTDIT